MEHVCSLPNGFGLYRKPNGVGGYIYMTDEYGVEHVIWDTALTDVPTLLAAIVAEQRRSAEEYVRREQMLQFVGLEPADSSTPLRQQAQKLNDQNPIGGSVDCTAEIEKVLKYQRTVQTKNQRPSEASKLRFKVGDRVMMQLTMTEYDIGTVTAIDPRDPRFPYSVVWDHQPEDICYHPECVLDNVHPVPHDMYPPERKYKVGDRVKLVGKRVFHGHTLAGTISKVCPNDYWQPYRVDWDNTAAYGSPHSEANLDPLGDEA